MEKNNFDASKLWKSILINNREKFSSTDLNGFRDVGGINSRLASWGPIDTSTRYYKTLLLNFIEQLDEGYSIQNLDMCEYLDKILIRSIGNPVTVNFNGREICLDYALCLEEFLFAHKILVEITSIGEIGAGFGRTCHCLLSICPNISSYVICDLPEMLLLSHNYLSHVLSEQDFKKIKFVPNDNVDQINYVDLCININSFQEMDPEVILSYLEIIRKISKFLFVKNPTCKYNPELINLQVPDVNEFRAVMSTGLCRDVVDIFNNLAVEEISHQYISKYCPEGFKCISDTRSILHRHYHSVLYQKA